MARSPQGPASANAANTTAPSRRAAQTRLHVRCLGLLDRLVELVTGCMKGSGVGEGFGGLGLGFPDKRCHAPPGRTLHLPRKVLIDAAEALRKDAEFLRTIVGEAAAAASA
jgi:hypothetical protein